ncbi:Histone acetyltransferase [Aphelenchoides fujianensis]|nr:Histone acetyltransferase [Aphelenchoides fujianensis]
MGMPNGGVLNGSGGMVMGPGPSQMSQQPMHSYHNNPSNGQPPQNVMVSMPPNAQQQQQPSSVLQELLLSSNTPGAMNSPRQQYNNTYSNRDIRSPAGASSNGQNMMSPPTSSMAMQGNRMPPHPSMRQQVPPGIQQPPQGPPGAQQPHRQPPYNRPRGPPMSDTANRVQCNLPHCGTMKAVLDHMIHCNNGRACNYPHCASSRQIITHWKNCSKDDCPVCKPLKTDGRHKQPCFEPRARQSALAVVIDDSASGLLMDYNPPLTNDPFRSANPPNKVAPSNGSGRNSAGFATDSFNNLPPPDPPNQEKEWHSLITLDLRNHLVSKLVKAIFPSPDPSAIHDQRLKDLISYARKVEKDMFENANNKEEYYHLLAEKIYKIQKELQEKKNRRLHEQGGGADTNFRPGGPGMPPVPMNNQHGMPGGMPNQAGPMGGGPGGRMPPAYGYPPAFDPSMPNQQPMQVQHPQQQPQSHQSLQNPLSIPPQSQPQSMLPQDPSTSHQMQFTPVNNVKTEPMEIKQEPVAPKIEQPAKPEMVEAPVDEKIFDSNELRAYLKPILEKLMHTEESIPLPRAREPRGAKIPDYYDIIKNPMDMFTMGKKLDCGEYRNPWEFCEDMWLMFDNAWLYNRKNSKVYKYCTKLSEVFIECINPVMRQMGFCCGQKLSFTPMALFCFGASTCIIARDQPYYLYDSGSSQYGVTVSDRYVYCVKCFEALPPEGINLSDNPSDPPNMASKDKFQLLKNDQIDPEPFEICKCCRRKWHRICALYSKKVFLEGFICDACRVKNSIPRPENKFTAKRLQTCKLSDYIENRVNTYVKNNCKAKCNYEVVIRVLCASEKDVEVKPLMKAKYKSEGFPEKFPYKTKAIFAFEVIDGVEVCFFGLHVQEYGSKCPPPNRRRVYIAYLDSVHFFQPRELRTDVYHEILLGYLQYVKNLGYTMAHIWACPPSEGDDYIFHCHPPEQKIPKAKRLQDWYKRMLDKGRQGGDRLRAKDDDLQCPTTLPYFEGDFWPNVIEDCIRDAEKEENERKKLEQSLAAAADDDEDDLYQTDDGVRLKKNTKSSKKKNNLKKLSKQKKKAASGTGNEVTDKLFSLLEKHKEVFFTIRLVSQQAELSINNIDIDDPDPLVSSELMDGRDTFLSKARDEHWEFSSMRRAKYSTLNFCHALHNQENKDIATYTCNKCGNNDGKWHCTVCDDYDLCGKCYDEIGHEHKMEEVKQLIEVDKSNESHNARNESVKKCIQSLVHACQCRDANCRRPTCLKMKRVVQHTKICKRRQTTNCPVCKQLIALCCYHAKHCNLAQCHPSTSHASQMQQQPPPQQQQQGTPMHMQHQHQPHMMASGSQQQFQSPHGQNAKPMHSTQPQHPGGHGGMNGTEGVHYQQQHMAPSKLNPTGMPHQQQMAQHQPPQYHQQPMGMQNQMNAMHMNQQSMQQRMHPNQQPHPQMQQQGMHMQHPHMMSGTGPSPSSKTAHDNDLRTNQQVCEIVHRLQTAQDGEERKRMFLELKKTPHLFAAFLKMRPNERNGQKLPPFDPQTAAQYAAAQPPGREPPQPPKHLQQQPQYYSSQS